MAMNLRHVAEVRRLELFFAFQTLLFGVWLLFPFEAMAGVAFKVLTDAVPEVTWGWLFFFNGLSHVIALFINGRRWWSPLVRWFAALCSALIYFGLAAGFATQNWMSTAVISYFSLGVGSSMCLYFAWVDAKIALEVKRRVSYYA